MPCWTVAKKIAAARQSKSAGNSPSATARSRRFFSAVRFSARGRRKSAQIAPRLESSCSAPQRNQAALRTIALRISLRGPAQEPLDRKPRRWRLFQREPDVGALHAGIEGGRLEEQGLLAAIGGIEAPAW